MVDPEHPDRDAAWRTKHGDQVRRTLDAGDPRAIKQLYVDMGALLEDSYGDDVAHTPLLSLPETVPVVSSLLADVDGVILDAGCGPHPAASIALAREPRPRTLVALDLSVGTVRLARARARADGAPILGVVGDLEALPFRDGGVDAALSDDTIEHVPDDRAAIAELMRATRPGAPVVVATPNRHSIVVLVAKARDRLRRRARPPSAYYAAESHLREYTRRELDELVRGIAVVERRASVGWSGGGLRRVATGLTRRPPMRGLGRMLVVRLRRR